MTYLDSNIFVYSMINNGKVGEKCREILRKVANQEINGQTSVLTWDEVVYSIRREKGKEIAVIEGNKFTKFPNLTFMKTNEQTMFLAQTLLTKYNIKPRDAIHAASAIISGTKEIISDDADFDKVKELKRISPEDMIK